MPRTQQTLGVKGYMHDRKGGEAASIPGHQWQKPSRQVLPVPPGPHGEVLPPQLVFLWALVFAASCVGTYGLRVATRLGVFCKEAIRPVPLAFLVPRETLCLSQET